MNEETRSACEIRRLFAVVSLGFACTFAQDAFAQTTCATELPSLPDVEILGTSAESNPVSHCKVAGVIGGKINFELLLPEDWNGKFVMGGGGGFVGSVMNTSLNEGSLQSGYATVGTDTGHQGHPVDGSWALNDLEAIVNFGHQAVHRTAVTAKALTSSYYQEPISRSYFTGCSRGGGQGIVAAMRYPEDFDAIAAGAPAINYNGVAALATRINRAMYPDPNDLSQAVVGPEAEKLIKRSYLAACDALDGLEDGILNDPRQCLFDVSTLQCSSGETNNCLTADEVEAAKTIYDDAKDRDGNLLMAGFNYGGEDIPAGWRRWLTGGLAGFSGDFQEGVGSGGFEAPPTPSAFYSFGNDLMRYFFYQDPNWSYVNYDFGNYLDDSAAVAETLNGTNPDLSEFRARGGKMIIYNGWSDMAVPTRETLRYYENVLAFDPDAVDDIRLFLIPGMDHCFGGVGPSYVNFLTEIDKWAESGEAPDEITAYWLDAQQQPAGARPVCAYPDVAKYGGSGDARDPASFSCGSEN